MTRPDDDDDRTPAALDRRGFKVLSLAGGVALAVLLVALGTSERDTETEPWIDVPPTVVPTAAGARAVATKSDGAFDVQHAETWTEFGPAAVAAYER